MPLPREEYNALLALMTKEAVPMRALTPEQRQRYGLATSSASNSAQRSSRGRGSPSRASERPQRTL
jgi:hypothetical protein